jgi:hypothetical protein
MRRTPGAVTCRRGGRGLKTLAGRIACAAGCAWLADVAGGVRRGLGSVTSGRRALWTRCPCGARNVEPLKRGMGCWVPFTRHASAWRSGGSRQRQFRAGAGACSSGEPVPGVACPRRVRLVVMRGALSKDLGRVGCWRRAARAQERGIAAGRVVGAVALGCAAFRVNAELGWQAGGIFDAAGQGSAQQTRRLLGTRHIGRPAVLGSCG